MRVNFGASYWIGPSTEGAGAQGNSPVSNLSFDSSNQIPLFSLRSLTVLAGVRSQLLIESPYVARSWEYPIFHLHHLGQLIPLSRLNSNDIIRLGVTVVLTPLDTILYNIEAGRLPQDFGYPTKKDVNLVDLYKRVSCAMNTIASPVRFNSSKLTRAEHSRDLDFLFPDKTLSTRDHQCVSHPDHFTAREHSPLPHQQRGVAFSANCKVLAGL